MPFLAKLPAQTSWKIVYQLKADAPAIQPHLVGPGLPPANILMKEYVFARNADFSWECTKWSDNKTTESWLTQNILFIQDYFLGNYFVRPSHGTVDFQNFAWVDGAHYRFVEKRGERSCYVYQTSEIASPPPPTADLNALASDADEERNRTKPAEPTTVWVDIETRLPIAIETPHLKGTFYYNVPLPKLTLPTECQKLLQLIRLSQERTNGQRMVTPP